jgi:hypothetical protein
MFASLEKVPRVFARMALKRPVRLTALDNVLNADKTNPGASWAFGLVGHLRGLRLTLNLVFVAVVLGRNGRLSTVTTPRPRVTAHLTSKPFRGAVGNIGR